MNPPFFNKMISARLGIFIVVLAALLAGGIAVWQYLATVNEAVKMPETGMPIVQDETVDWQTYRNEEYGFEIKYPEGWKIESIFPGRLGPGEIEPREGVSPQSFLFSSRGRDLAREQSDIILYVAPAGFFNCSNYANFFADDVGEFLEQNSYKDEIEFCKSNIYFRFSKIASPKEIFNQILSTFRFIEKGVASMPLTPEEVISNPATYDGKEMEVHGIIELIPFVDEFGLGGASPGFRTPTGDIMVSNWDRVNDVAQKKSEVMVRGTFDADSKFIFFLNDCADCFLEITPQP